MDPNATLREALYGLEILGSKLDDRDIRAQAATALEDLAEWLRKGGFVPTVTHKAQLENGSKVFLVKV